MKKHSPGYALLFLVAAIAGYPMRFFFRVAPDTASIIPPASPGSLGDEAMVSVVRENLLRRKMRVRIVRLAPHDRWEETFDGVESIGPAWDSSRGFAGRLKGLIRTLSTLLRSEETWCIGADVMDGHYDARGTLRAHLLLTFLGHAGRTVTVTGFSWNTHPAPSSIEGMRRVSRHAALYCRDPISNSRLALDGIDAKLAADLAFLLEPSASPGFGTDVGRLLSKAQEERSLVIGVCPHLVLKGQALDAEITVIAGTMERMMDEHVDAVGILVSHDTRRNANGTGQNDILRMIFDRIPERLKGRVAILPARNGSARDVRALCSRFSFAVSGSMHFTISCLSQGVPTVSLTYQDKFEGLFAHARLPTDELSVPQSVLSERRHALDELVAPLFLTETRQRHARTIADALPEIRRLARSQLPPA